MEHEVISEISARTELLLTEYQIIEEACKNRVVQSEVDKLEREFKNKSA